MNHLWLDLCTSTSSVEIPNLIEIREAFHQGSDRTCWRKAASAGHRLRRFWESHLRPGPEEVSGREESAVTISIVLDESQPPGVLGILPHSTS